MSPPWTPCERTGHHGRGTAQQHADDVAKMVEFTRESTDGCHHSKEEKVLFPRLKETSPVTHAPVSVMLAEHEQGRAHVRDIAEALPQAHAGDRDAAMRVADGLDGYASLLRPHIDKENNVLFPLAERVLSPDAKAAVAADFERIELQETGAGVHERYHAMAHELGAHTA